MSSTAWKVAMTKAASEVAEHLSTPEDVIWAEDAASRILSLPEPPEFRAAVEAEMGEVVEMLREAQDAIPAVLTRSETLAMRKARTRLRKLVSDIDALLSRIGEK